MTPRLNVSLNEEAQRKLEELKAKYEEDFGISITYATCVRIAISEALKLTKQVKS